MMKFGSQQMFRKLLDPSRHACCLKGLLIDKIFGLLSICMRDCYRFSCQERLTTSLHQIIEAIMYMTACIRVAINSKDFISYEYQIYISTTPSIYFKLLIRL